MESPHALLMPNFKTTLASGHLRDIIDENESFVIHTNLTHLTSIMAFVTVFEMLLEGKVEVIEKFFEVGEVADHVKSQITVTQHQQLLLFVCSGADKSLPGFTFDHIEHFVYYTPPHEQASQLWHILKHGVLFLYLDYAVLLEEFVGLLADSLLLRRLHKVHFPWNVN